MADVKWIKIVVDIFDDEKIQLIEALPSADTIIVIWFKILCLAGKCKSDGVLMMNERIAYTDEMLAAVFRRKVTDVRMALEVFEKYGMIEIIRDAYVIPNWSKHQSMDFLERKRSYDREYRKQKREEQKRLLEDKTQEEEKSRTTVVRTSYDPSYSYSNNIYSYSSHLNIDNLQHILTNSIYKDTNYIKDNISLLDSIREWMEYKDAKKPASQHHYDTEQGICKLLTRIVNFAKANGIDAMVDAIDYSIGNNYQGIVFEVRKQNKPTRSERQRDAFDEFLRGGDG